MTPTKLLKLFLNKSFSKLARNAVVSNGIVAEVLETAAMTQDFLENTSKKLGNRPNADIIFKRIEACNEEKLLDAFMFILGIIVKAVRQKLNHRQYTLAIDAHYEPFYGVPNGFWLYGYKPTKGCTGSFRYMTISIVIGEERFTLMALPTHIGQNQAELVDKLVKTAQKFISVKLVLLDRGFYSGEIIEALRLCDVKYIVFAPQTEINKGFLEEVEPFSHKYFTHVLPLKKNRSNVGERVKLLVIKDFIDMTNWKIYDWIFVTNLSNLAALSYVKLYKKRWGIETTYRMFGDIKIKTTSKNYFIRFFLFLVRIVIYNMWKFYNIINGTSKTLNDFVFMLFLTFVNIDYIGECKAQIEQTFGLLAIEEYEES